MAAYASHLHAPSRLCALVSCSYPYFYFVFVFIDFFSVSRSPSCSSPPLRFFFGACWMTGRLPIWRNQPTTTAVQPANQIRLDRGSMDGEPWAGRMGTSKTPPEPKPSLRHPVTRHPVTRHRSPRHRSPRHRDRWLVDSSAKPTKPTKPNNWAGLGRAEPGWVGLGWAEM